MPTHNLAAGVRWPILLVCLGGGGGGGGGGDTDGRLCKILDIWRRGLYPAAARARAITDIEKVGHEAR